MKTENQCSECLNAPVSHGVVKSMNMLGVVMSTFEDLCMQPFLNLGRLLPRPNPRTQLKWYTFLAHRGMGTLLKEPDSQLSHSAQTFWKEGLKRNIEIREFRLFGVTQGLFFATFAGRTIVYEGLPRPGKQLPASLFWVDDKELLTKKFRQAGFPVARGSATWRLAHAQKIFHELEKPLIVKPSLGSRSRHTTVHINTPEEFEQAVVNAQRLFPRVIVEEELSGMVHRATLFGGEIAGIVRREPPYVVGDGIHTIRELVEKENMRPERNGDVFGKIVLESLDHEPELRNQNLTLDAIPEAGREVTVYWKASCGIGGGLTDVTDVAHPDNVKLFKDVAHFLNDPIVGIDIIIPDMTISWKEQPRAGIIECNSFPFIDLHMFPLRGEPRNTAVMLWELVFPELSSSV